MHKNRSITGLILWLLICSYIVFFGRISYLKYISFAYYDFDLAIHSQTIWNILHGSIHSSILGIDFLGNHAHFILFLVAPIYFLFQSPLTLLFLQTFSLALAAYPIYLIGRKELGEKLALSIAFAYLIYPSLGHVNLFEFHPTVFATLFLSFMFYFFGQGYFKTFVLFMFLSLLCQENIPLLVVALGIYALFTKKSFRWTVVPVSVGILWFWLMAVKLIPYFNKNTVQFFSIYGHLGGNFFEIIKTAITNPAAILKILFIKNNITYLAHLFAPVAFLPLLGPQILLIIPMLMQHLLSSRWIEHTIYAHYTAEMLPIIFVATVYGLKRLLSFSIIKKYLTKKVFVLLIVGVAVTSNIYLGPHLGAILTYKNLAKDIEDSKAEVFIDMIPKDAAVVATFKFLPKLAHRKKLYSFHHVISGFHTLSDKLYCLPEETEYALVDFADELILENFYKPRISDVNLRNFFYDNNWGVVDMAGGMVLLKKGHKSRYSLYEVTNRPNSGFNPLFAKVNEELELIGYNIEHKDYANGDEIGLTFFWEALRDIEKDYGCIIDIIDSDGKLKRRFARRVCYGIYPSYAWKKKETIKESYKLILSSEIKKGYSVKMRIIDYGVCVAYAFVSPILDAVDTKGRVNLIVQR